MVLRLLRGRKTGQAMSTQAMILCGVAVYMMAMLAVGYLASKRTRSVAEFMVAGRGLPVWLCSITVIATWFGGAMMLGGAGAAYDEGMMGVIEDPWGGALALLLIGLFFARLFRRLRIITVVDFMEQRYGRVAGAAMTLSSLFANIMWAASMLVAFGTIFNALTSVPMEAGILVGAVIIILYTMIGGMWAVALTDFVQLSIIMAGLVVLFVVVLVDAGGWGQIYPHLDDHTFRMIPFDNSLDQWLNYLRAWTIIGIVDISAQTLFQRVAAAKTERVAQNAFYVGAAGYLFFGLLAVFLGIIGSVTMPELGNSETVIPELAKAHLHPIAIAIFVGAVLAAIMSTGDSVLLASASVIAKNILPYIRRNPSDRLTMQVARWSIPACGLIAILIAMKIQVVFNLMVDANILGLAAIIVPFVLGVWWTKANRTGALSSMAIGISAWLATLWLRPDWPADFMGLAACLVTMLVVTPLTQSIDPPRELRDSDGNPVELKDRLGTLSPFGKD